MNYFENTKFSRYQFNSTEMNNMFNENKEHIALCENVQYIICADDCSFEQADEEIHNLFKLLKKISENPNYSNIKVRFLYIKGNIGSIEYYNPMLIVDKDTWMFVKGMMVYASINHSEI